MFNVKEVESEIKKVPVPRLTAYISFYPERATGEDPLFSFGRRPEAPGLRRSLMTYIEVYPWIPTY